MKILFLKAKNEAVQRVRDGRGNEYEGAFGIETGGLFVIIAAACLRARNGLARGFSHILRLPTFGTSSGVARKGPNGANGFYEKAGEAVKSTAGDQHWAQYRIIFAGLGVGNSSVVKSVEMECDR